MFLHLICCRPFDVGCLLSGVVFPSFWLGVFPLCIGVFWSGSFFFLQVCAHVWLVVSRQVERQSSRDPRRTHSKFDLMYWFSAVARRAGGMNSRLGHRNVPGRHKKPKCVISCHCTSQLVGLHEMPLHALRVLHFLLVVCVNISCFSLFVGVTFLRHRRRHMDGFACVCAKFLPMITLLFFFEWRHSIFTFPLGFHIPACVWLDARESDVVGPTCNVNTTQKIYCSNPEWTKRCCLECAAKPLRRAPTRVSLLRVRR